MDAQGVELGVPPSMHVFDSPPSAPSIVSFFPLARNFNVSLKIHGKGWSEKIALTRRTSFPTFR
jgi:hypothetical protein